MLEFLLMHHFGPVVDSTSGEFDDTVFVARSAWTEAAATSDNPVDELRAAVIRLADVEEFKKVHDRIHPMGCKTTPGTQKRSLLYAAITRWKGEFVKFLLHYCQEACRSVNFTELFYTGFYLELVGLLVTKGFLYPSYWEVTDYHQKAAANAKFELVKLLLKLGVPPAEFLLTSALECSRAKPMALYLSERYQHCITSCVMENLACESNFELFCKVHELQRDCSCNSDVLKTVVCRPWTSLEFVRFMYEHHPSIRLTETMAREIWKVERDQLRLDHRGSHEEVLVFMWLVRRDAIITRSFAADHEGRILLYIRLRARVPTVFDGVQMGCRGAASFASYVSVSTLERSRWPN